MATLVAIAYPDQGTAEEARGVVQSLEADLVIQADQVAAISRDADGKYHVTTTHGGATAGAGAWWGGFWGLLFGLLFFIPLIGMAVGAAMGALAGSMTDIGINDDGCGSSGVTVPMGRARSGRWLMRQAWPGLGQVRAG